MLELLTSALMAGRSAGVTSAAAEAIKDAYTGLKNALVAKSGRTKAAMDALEDEPDDEDAQKLVGKRLAEADVDTDAGVLAAANTLRAALKAADISVGAVTQTATGMGHMQVVGNNNRLTSNIVPGNQVNTGGGAYVAGSVSAGGDFVGRDKIIHNHNVAPELSDIPSTARALVPLLNQYFGLSDIDSLCFEMGIDDEQLRGQTKDEKARSMVTFVEQNGRLDELKKLMRKARPNLRTQLS